MERKNRHWYDIGPEYKKAEFLVKVIIGAADLKFQIWTKDNRLCSADHEDIQVRWDPPWLHSAADDEPNGSPGIYKV